MEVAMSNEMMDVDQLALYLQRDAREVHKLANRGYLPGHKVSGQWRFHQAEINHWIENQMHAYTEQELARLETVPGRVVESPLLVSAMLSEATMAVPLVAGTKSSVLMEMVKLAEQSWQLYDAPALLEAIRQREEMNSTAMDQGVAIPHPHRPLPNILGESLIAYGRTSSGIPFGAGRGGLTDMFFLVCCRDGRTHLRVLARLSRLLMRPAFVDELRAAETVAETYQVIERAEHELIAD
jgi:PTS system nitrogen regulatory IIA component